MSKLPVLTAAGLMAGFLLFARADSQMMHEPPPGPGAQGKAMDIRTCPEPMGKRMHAGFGFYLNLADRLKLTQAQVEQLSSMKFEYQKADIQRRAGLQTSELELRQLRGADDVDAKKVEAAIRDLHGKMAEQEIAALRAQTEARKVLTHAKSATTQIDMVIHRRAWRRRG